MVRTFPSPKAEPLQNTSCSDPEVVVPPRCEVSVPGEAVTGARAGLALVGLAGLMLLGGCGGDGGDDGVAACRQHQPTISGGVYGCITQSNDVGDPWVKPLPKFSIEIFQSPKPPMPNDGLVPLTRTESDAIGFYQINLPAGSFWICTSFRQCAALDQPTGRPIARDYDFGQGPSWAPR